MQAEQAAVRNTSSSRAKQITNATIAVEAPGSYDTTTADAITAESSPTGTTVHVANMPETAKHSGAGSSSSVEGVANTATRAVCADVCAISNTSSYTSASMSIDVTSVSAAIAATTATASGIVSNSSRNGTVLPHAKLTVNTMEQAVVSSKANTVQVSSVRYVEMLA
jgi:hypothetical protein